MRNNRTPVYFWTATTAMSVTLLLCAQSAQAQAAAPADNQSSGLADIVVTAQKRSENLQRVPIAVTAISGSTLVQSGIQNAIALPQVTPNLVYSSNADNVASYIRGVGTQFATTGLEPSVAVYFDDQYIVRPSASLFAFSDVQRIEVLKGPQGTLYGRNATGGAIRIITNDPAQKFGAGASLTYGSFNRVAASGFVNVPVTDTLAARVSIDYDDKDGYVRNDNPSLPKLQDRHQITGHGKVLWQPTDRLKVKLSGDYTDKRDHEGQAFLPYPNSAPEQIGIALGSAPSSGFYHALTGVVENNDLAYKFHTRSGGGTVRADYEFDGFTLSSITGYRSIKFDGPADADTVAAQLLDVRSIQNTASYSEEIQAVSKGSGPFKWTVGLYGYKEKSSYDYLAWGAFSGVPAGNYFAGDGTARTRSLAPYGQISYEITQKLELTAGARYTWERKRLVGNTLVVGALDAGDLPVPGSEVVVGQIPGDTAKFKQFTPKFVLSYKPISGVLLYASYSKGFKSGGYNLPSFGSVDKVNPEKLTSYEIGWKTQFGDLRFNGSAFMYDDRDLQVQYVNQAGSIGIQNAATAHIKGVESDLTWAATRALELGLGGGYLDTKFKKYVGTEYIPSTETAACLAAPASAACLGFTAVPADLSGNRLPLAPKFTGYARAQYTVPLGGSGSLVGNALVSWSTNYFYDAAMTIKEPGRALVNGSITWKSDTDRYEVSLFGTNLTDHKYAVFRTHFATGGWYTPAAPAEFGIKLSVRY